MGQSIRRLVANVCVCIAGAPRIVSLGDLGHICFEPAGGFCAVPEMICSKNDAEITQIVVGRVTVIYTRRSISVLCMLVDLLHSATISYGPATMVIKMIANVRFMCSSLVDTVDA